MAERGAELARFVERFAARRLELLEAAWTQEDALGTEELGGELERGLAQGTPERARATAVLTEMKAKAGALEVLNGQRRLRELWSTVGAVGTAQQADELAARIRKLADEHHGTQVERSAAAHLETIAALKSILR